MRCKRSSRFVNYLYLDIIIISDSRYWFQKCLGYRKVKTVRVYVWIGLTIIFSFEKDFEKLNKRFEFTHTSPMTDPEFILFVFPKLLGAQICTGSQVVGIFQIHLEELEAGGFTSSYRLSYFPLCTMLYLETGGYNCSRDNRCALIMVCIYKY